MYLLDRLHTYIMNSLSLYSSPIPPTSSSYSSHIYEKTYSNVDHNTVKMQATLHHSSNKAHQTVKMRIIFLRLFITAKGFKTNTLRTVRVI